MAATPDDEVRRAYLDGRDVPCPKCGYNLRGTTGDACPECGLKIVLEVAGRRAWSAPALFAFIAFGWGLTAGLLNSIRNGVGLYQQALTSPLYGTPGILGGRIQVRGNTMIYSPGSMEFSWDALWALPASEWIDPVWSMTCSLLAITGLVLVVIALRSREPSWRAVRLVAIALYGIYGGYHLVMFARQMSFW